MIRTFRRFLASPGTIGTISPSSPALARAIVKQIGKGVTVFEIGAGTGAITRHLQRIEQPGPLVVFEQDPQFAEYLRRRVGAEQVVEGLFHDTVAGVGEFPEPLVIISSVPFRSLPGTLHKKTVDAICDRLRASPGSRLIQYTYFNRPPFVPSHESLRWRRVARVWANVPPATVWELRAETAATEPEYVDTGIEVRWQDEDRVAASTLHAGPTGPRDRRALQRHHRTAAPALHRNPSHWPYCRRHHGDPNRRCAHGRYRCEVQWCRGHGGRFHARWFVGCYQPNGRYRWPSGNHGKNSNHRNSGDVEI